MSATPERFGVRVGGVQDALLQAQNDLATLSGVVREIADLAAENTDLDSPWNRVVHICSLPAVRNALTE